MIDRERWNAARFVPGDRRGHYESFFQRANHPERALAFWIRYTVFCPRGVPDAAVGELWAIYFDGERGRTIAVKEEHPIGRCRFDRTRLDARVGASRLDSWHLDGRASNQAHTIAWALGYTSHDRPLLLLPEALYAGPFPKAKALVGSPNSVFDGALEVDGERVAIDGWIGSQNHNWGSEHTARYAWGQVAGFDEAPDSFLEISTAQVRIGPALTPPLTVLVLRIEGEELRFTSIPKAIRARASYQPFRWEFETGDRKSSVSGVIQAPPTTFIAVPYANPPGGTKTCLNSKLASCEVCVSRRGHGRRTLRTAHRAAFEILGDDPPPPSILRLD